MSTRANIAIKDDQFGAVLWFYRHNDGYPKGALPTLRKFMEWVTRGDIRSSLTQAAGWLIMIGNREYYKDGIGPSTTPTPTKRCKWSTWKVGAYEPTVARHREIAYLYVLNLANREIAVYATGGAKDELLGHILFAKDNKGKVHVKVEGAKLFLELE